MKIAHKLSLALVGGIVLVHAGSTLQRVERERRLFREDMARDDLVLGRALSHAVERAFATAGEREAMSLIEHVTDRKAHVHIRWVWLDAPRGDRRAPAASAEQLQSLAAGKTVTVVLYREKGDDGALYTYVPVRIPGDRAGAIEISELLADESAYLRASVVTGVVRGVILSLLCALIAWGLSATMVGRPVALLVEQARRVGAGDLGHRLRIAARTEIGDLARDMDAMVDGLQRARTQLAAESHARLAALEQLRHADRLTTVGTLAAGVAHELGTPINVIHGHAQLIGEDPQASAGSKERATVISRQCDRMTEIIRHLLDFARRGGRDDSRADLLGVAREALRMLEPIARKRGVQMILDPVVDALPAVQIAPGQAQQVLTNLVLNGLQASPDGSRLVVRVGSGPGEECPAPPPRGRDVAELQHVWVEVEDTGIGIDEATLPRIFEPFFTTKDVGAGTGLGLSVACGIIEDHGGWIGVASRPGKGSCFTTCLPAAPPLDEPTMETGR